MKDIRPGLFSFLHAYAPISAQVTANGFARIFPIVLPQGIKQPSIVYSRISSLGDYEMEGRTGLARTRIQIAAWAPTADAAASLANLVKDRVDGYSGMMGDVRVQGVFQADERELYDDTLQLYGVSRDYFLWCEEL